MPGSGDGDRATPSASPAAARLDREVTHLAQLEGQVDREVGKGLALLWDRERYRPLGFVRATDFVREMLGIQESRARWLAKLGRCVAAVPELDQALAQDRICLAGDRARGHPGRIVSRGACRLDRARWPPWSARATPSGASGEAAASGRGRVGEGRIGGAGERDRGC
jgi:hypothetical protein